LTLLHNGSDLTAQVNGIQKVGGDISLVAVHRLEAIAWSFNPVSVGSHDQLGATITGRNVKILADADNDVLFNGDKDPLGIEGNCQRLKISIFQQKSEALLDFIINFRPIIGVSLSKATATVSAAATSVIQAQGGNVLIEGLCQFGSEGVHTGAGRGLYLWSQRGLTRL